MKRTFISILLVTVTIWEGYGQIIANEIKIENIPNGNVGIGVSSPSHALDIAGAANMDAMYSKHGRVAKNAYAWNNSSPHQHHLEVNSPNIGDPYAYVGILFHQDHQYWRMLRVNTDGFHFTDGGSLNYFRIWASAFTQTSDRSLKEGVTTLGDALSTVQQLRGVSFRWKQSGEPSLGFIAQEVQEVLPELVKGSNGTLSVEYANITAVLVEAIKELKAATDREIEVLKEKNKTLQSRTQKAEAKLLELESRLQVLETSQSNSTQTNTPQNNVTEP